MKHARNVMLAEVGLLDTIRESTSHSDILSLEVEAKPVEAPQVEAPQPEQCMSAVVESPPSVISEDESEKDHMKLFISMVKSNDRKLYGSYRQIQHHYLIIENALLFEKNLHQS
jgi:hypothetical protein